ncbi:MAG: hypothetical protein ACRDG7_02140, partial [Candidatus Limnocylindria bacterium]
VVRLLSATASHGIAEGRLRRGLALDEKRVGPRLDQAGWERIIDGLERDGLAHRSGGIVRLGAATI